MNEASERPNHFIRHIIEKDLAQGKHVFIKTRFPPEPNGYLHIGHAKSICLNFGLAQDYQGECHLRFDDTNPEKEEQEYIESIKRDVQWLGFSWHGAVRYSSDYFETLYGYAIELIQKGLAYVDELSAEKMREYRGTLTEPGKNSPFRDRKVEENLALFKKMRAGDFVEGAACLRAKIDMASPFMVMRDPVLYRVKLAHHHKLGHQWFIYPMYDFTHCISDALEGITHSLCTLEFQDNRRLYDWVLDHISIDCHPRQYEFSRLNLEHTVMSKRKLHLLVTEKKVSGWDDPRMPTLSGLRRRGYTPASIREFCHRIGVTKQDNQVEISALESCIREDLNQNAPRALAVLDPILLIIDNRLDQKEWLTVPNHPNDLSMGHRQMPFNRVLYIDRADFREQANKQYKRLVLGKEVRLRYAYVVKAKHVEKNAQGMITAIHCEYDPKTLNQDPSDGRKIKGVIHWVCADDALPAEIRLYHHLLTGSQVHSDLFLESVNPESLVIRQGFVETSLSNTQVGKTYQFEREGYFCTDKDSSPENLVFNRTVSLRGEGAFTSPVVHQPSSQNTHAS